MSGILVYTKEEAKRNSFSVEKFTKLLDVFLVDEKFTGDADFVINRTNDYRIGELYERRGIRVFNPSSLSYLANDKQLCYEFMNNHGIPIMPVNYKGVPAVKKKIDGHGGKDVFMIEKKEPFENGYVYQKPCDTLGKDLRVWVLGGRIICSALRESETDFRSNFCLGGNASLYEMNDDEIALVNKIGSLLNYDYIGIDFLFDDGHLVFNEIEDTVGARMVYSKTKIDIIGLYCNYIKACI